MDIKRIGTQPGALGGPGAARETPGRGSEAVRRPAGPAAPAAPAAPAPRRTDELHISDAGRALAERAAGIDSTGGGETAPATGTLGTERTLELRSRILQGAYDTIEAAGAIAQRILGSGDL